MKLITPSALVERLKINASLARAAIKELEASDTVKRVSYHHAQWIYTRSTKVGGACHFLMLFVVCDWARYHLLICSLASLAVPLWLPAFCASSGRVNGMVVGNRAGLSVVRGRPNSK